MIGVESLSDLERWLHRKFELFVDFPKNNSNYYKSRPNTPYLRDPAHAMVATRIGLARVSIDEAHQWLTRHGIYNAPDRPDDLTTIVDAEREIETLLRFIGCRIANDARTDSLALRAVSLLIEDYGGDAAAGLGLSEDPKWDEATEARNKWVYDECMKLTLYKLIIAGTQKQREWESLNEISSVKRAANAYAKRYSLPAPPPRQSGRLKKK